jgi:hypothetical protein
MSPLKAESNTSTSAAPSATSSRTGSTATTGATPTPTFIQVSGVAQSLSDELFEWSIVGMTVIFYIHAF